jgi:hypothetical protein
MKKPNEVGHRVRGLNYQSTIGQLLDYKGLASYLIQEIRAQERWSFFWDAPCGDGHLLELLEMSLPEYPLFGLDSSEAQLEVAARRVRRATLVLGDIFEISATSSGVTSLVNGVCHMGFCFLNTLAAAKRVELLQHLRRARPNIATLALEIQNTAHYARKYKPGVRYDSVLPNGTNVCSISESLGPGHRKLSMTFRRSSEVTHVEDELYDVPIHTLESESRSVGWTQIDARPATYRGMHDGVNSHWFVLLR